MTNGPQGDYWHEHFSADEFCTVFCSFMYVSFNTKIVSDILPVLMAFTIAYSLLLLAIVICSIELKSRQLLHSTYKLFVSSVTIQFFGIIIDSMAYLKYAVNGVGAPNARIIGKNKTDETILRLDVVVYVCRFFTDGYVGNVVFVAASVAG